VNANAAQRLGKLAVIGKDGTGHRRSNRAALWEEARCGGKPERAELAALVARAKTLRGVIEHEQALGCATSAIASWSALWPNRSTGITARGFSPRCRAVAMPRSSEAGSMLKVSSSTSTKTGAAPVSATASPVAQT